jgi:hypothetical protein
MIFTINAVISPNNIIGLVCGMGAQYVFYGIETESSSVKGLAPLLSKFFTRWYAGVLQTLLVFLGRGVRTELILTGCKPAA